MNDLISVIIPIYNAEKYLEELLYSVINQTYFNLEILLINDGSVDSCEKICMKYSAIDTRIKYYNNTNRGVSFSRNFGIKQSTGKYVTFIDADDIVAVDFIETLYKNMKNSGADCSIIGIKSFNIKPKLDFKIKGIVTETTNEEKLFSLFNKYGGFLANKMYIRDLIIKNDIFLDESIHMSEDLLFNLLYFEKCKKVVYDKKILYFYRIYSNSSYYNINNKRWFSIIDTYKIILKKYLIVSEELKNIIIYNLFMMIFEAHYRNKKLDKDLLIEKELYKLKSKVSKMTYKFTIIQNIKIFLFKNFPDLVIKYKKIKVRR